MQQYTVYLCLQTAVHVSGGISTHHQELKTLYLQYLVLLSPLRYLLWTFTTGSVTVSIMPDTVDTVIWALDDVWRYHPKHVQQFADINKLYIVASWWTIIDTYYAMHGPLNIKYSLYTERKTVCIKSVHTIYSNLSNTSHSYRFNRIEVELHCLL